MALLASLLNEFYRENLSYFPVVKIPEAEADTSQKSAAKKKITKQKQKHLKHNDVTSLIGFLSRKRLQLWGADIERLNQNYKHIPQELLITQVSSTAVLADLNKGKFTPVLNCAGLKINQWDENQLLQALSHLNKKRQLTKQDSQAKQSHSASNDVVHHHAHWLGNLLLKSFPWPLYACDLNGKTLFFNGLFENELLTKPKIKNSLRRMESYLMEVVRDLLASSFLEEERLKPKGDPPQKTKYRSSPLSSYDHSLDHRIHITNLEENGHIHGYFFIFQAEKDFDLNTHLGHRMQSNVGLNAIIDEIEARVINDSLTKNRQNVSHTAKALKVKRSTLQNKIQRLELDKRFGRSIEGPIHRNRKPNPKQNKQGTQANNNVNAQPKNKSHLNNKTTPKERSISL